MKKTIQEIKNEVAVKHGYKDWRDADLCTSYDQSDALVSEAMQEYAKQRCDEQILQCAEVLKKGTPNKLMNGNLKEYVIQTPNVVTTK